LPVNFANPQQRKFYLIMRAFKIGNILKKNTFILLNKLRKVKKRHGQKFKISRKK